MSTIDKRVVQMAFENGQFEKNVSTSLDSIARLKKGLNFNDSVKSMSALSTAGKSFSLSTISEGVDNISSKFSAFGIMGVATLMRIANAAIDAGVALVKSLTIDPVKMGYDDYTRKLNSIQTVTANTGKSVEYVEGYFDQLDQYADKTIYNLDNMTSAMAKFVNAGVNLDTAVPAIKGIANMVALAGQDANAAGVAYYNLSQSISGGFLTTMDYRSLNLANVATKEWKEYMVSTAVAIGTLKKEADGLYKVVGATGSDAMAMNVQTLFNQGLSSKWASTDVMMKVFGDYGDITTDIGKKAYASAMDIKSWGMMMTTLRESVGTGWTDTFQILLGDLDQAKALFTPLSKVIQGFLDSTTKSRNDLLTGWAELNGRNALIDALKAFSVGILQLIKPIKFAFEEIFPAITSQRLWDITLAFRELSERFKMGEKPLSEIKRIFKGLFALIDIGRMGFVALANGVGKVAKALLPAGVGFVDLMAKVGDFILNLRDSIKATDIFNVTIDKIAKFLGGAIATFSIFFDGLRNGFSKIDEKTGEGFTSFVDRLKARLGPLSKVAEVLGKLFDFIGEKLPAVKEVLSKVATSAGELFTKALDGILGAIDKISFEKFSFKGLFDGINAGLLTALGFSLLSFTNKGNGLFSNILGLFKGMKGFADGATGILTGITSVLEGVRGSLVAWQESLRAGVLTKIATAVAILAASLIALSLIDSKKLTVAIAAISTMFADIFASMYMFDKFAKPGTAISTGKMVIGLMGMSLALLAMSGAVAILANVDPIKLANGLGALAVVIAEVVAFMMAAKYGSIGVKQAAGLMVVAFSMMLLAGAVKIFGNLDETETTKGLTTMGLILAGVAAFSVLSSKAGSVTATAGSLVIMGGAMMIFSLALERLAELSWPELAVGLTGMAGALTAVVLAMTFMPKDMMLTGLSMVVVAGAMYILAKAVTLMGGMSWDEVGRGLAVLGGSLTILAVALSFMTTTLPGSAALLIAAGAIALLTPQLLALGNMSWAELGMSMLALAGVFTILGLAGLVLTPVVPTLAALGGAMLLIGLAALVAGLGVSAFAAGLSMLAISGAAGAVALGLAITTVANLLPMVAEQLGKAFILWLDVIAKAAPKIFNNMKLIIVSMVKALGEAIPEIVIVALDLVNSLFTALSDKLPEIIKKGYEILVAFLTGVKNNIGEITLLAYDIITNFIVALTEKIPGLVDAGVNLIIAFVDGLALAMEDGIPALMVSVNKLSIAIMEGLLQGWIDMWGNIREAVVKMGTMIINEFKEILGIHSPSTVFAELAKNIILGLVNGLTDFMYLAAEAAVTMAQSVLTSVKKVFETKSPSKVTTTIGKYVAQGLANGITKFGSQASDAAGAMASNAISAMSGVMSRISDVVNSEMNVDPTIRPVIDMSEIVKGGLQIDKLMGEKKLSVTSSLNKVDEISKAVNDKDLKNVDAGSGSTTNSVVFNQVNNSPKELSRIEIYRQTNNQLRQLKGI